MSPKTFQEQSFYNMLPTDLQEVADVSFEFQQKLHIIQDVGLQYMCYNEIK